LQVPPRRLESNGASRTSEIADSSTYNAMRTQNDDPQNSDAQHQTDDGCPSCGGPIQAVERRGPGDVTVQPCGHKVSDTLARNFGQSRDQPAITDGGAETAGFQPTPPTEIQPEYRVETDDGSIISYGRYRELTADEWDVEELDERRTRMRAAVAAIRDEGHEHLREIEFEDPDYDAGCYIYVRLTDDCNSTAQIACLLREHGLRIYTVNTHDGHLAAWVHEDDWKGDTA
jgi:hypothetical protein